MGTCWYFMVQMCVVCNLKKTIMFKWVIWYYIAGSTQGREWLLNKLDIDSMVWTISGSNWFKLCSAVLMTYYHDLCSWLVKRKSLWMGSNFFKTHLLVGFRANNRSLKTHISILNTSFGTPLVSLFQNTPWQVLWIPCKMGICENFSLLYFQEA